MLKFLKEWSAFFIISFLGFGSSFYCIKLTLNELTSLEIVTYRVVIGGIFLLIISLVYKISLNINFLKMLKIMFLGVFGMAIPYWLIIWAEKYVSSSLASVLASFTPIFTLILSIFIISKHELNTKSIASTLIGFIGIIIVFSNKFLSVDISHILPEIAIVLATFFYAISGIYAKKYFNDTNSVTISLYSTLGSSLCLLPILFLSQSSIHIPRNSIPPLIWMAVVGTALSSILMYHLIKQWGPLRASMISYFIPLSAITLGYVNLNEKLNREALIGGSLILIAIFASNKTSKCK